MLERISAGTGSLGVILPSGCRVTHGDAANVKRPFDAIPVVMHELDAGIVDGQETAFRGQFGFIPFRDDLRLPRHVHLGSGTGSGHRSLVTERILVLNGLGLVELAGQVYLVAPESLVEISPGIPHTWTACPAGVVLPDGTASDGSFLMVYEYSEPTGFSPIEGTTPLASVSDYHEYHGDLEAIRFPLMRPEQVAECASYVWGGDVRSDLRASTARAA